ncbi:MAG: Ribonuclease Z beta-lactamase superfamily hydrolase [Candidatus Methanohalarchaeum thermophilum]|uniref:Ribonuclease Z n=1 Tax=Methanohalarchaeum thermophilum TaxID=1903181 RepID=A0A1Q6DTE5_METT1|nr:MAG: Ribonuclease Z beta-lactamase superfamily hydrolase [Candidatus Methanohalarchaeum thermophilum]
MSLEVIFLGTAGATPTVERNPPAILIKRKGRLILFDCGEGTQRQMMKGKTGMSVETIYITHLHADHFLGLPGLIQTMAFQGRQEDLEIIGPLGTKKLMENMSVLGLNTPKFDIDIKEVSPGDEIKRKEFKVRVIEAEHGRNINCLGYVLEEDQRPGKFNREKAIDLGVEPGPDFGKLQKGQEIEVNGKIIKPEQVLGPPRPGRKIVYSGDTRPTESIKKESRSCDLLIHDGTLTLKEKERAIETKHTTAREAAKIAKETKPKLLALFHLSSRYSNDFYPLLNEAKEIYEDTIVPKDFTKLKIPYPEKERDIEIDI